MGAKRVEIVIFVCILVAMVVLAPMALSHIVGETGWTAVWTYYYGTNSRDMFPVSVTLYIVWFVLLLLPYFEIKGNKICLRRKNAKTRSPDRK